MELRPPFISRIIIKNYKSIARCDVHLGALQFLVGRNGSGKSNFLDALAFVRDALADNLDHAFNIRQGVNQVRRRSGGHPTNFGVYLEFELPDKSAGIFGFELTAKSGEQFKVKREECRIAGGEGASSYQTIDGKIQNADKKQYPPVADDRLYLQSMATFGVFRPLYDALRTIGIYNINPKLMATPHNADTETLLKTDGANIAASLFALHPDAKERIREYLQSIVPFVSDFAPKGQFGKAWQLVEFSQAVKSQTHPWRFPANNMSDGTLRALGILTALLHKQRNGGKFSALVGIEEPETALHARASGALLGALQEASDMRQVIVTTHSAELLGDKEIKTEQILPVELRESETLIAPLDKISQGILRDHLATAGELLRQDMLPPDKSLFPKNADKYPLFPREA